MAHLTNCPVCGGPVVDEGVHPRCQVAVRDDILFQIQKFMRDHPEFDFHFPVELQGKIMQGQYKSLAESIQQLKNRELTGSERAYDHEEHVRRIAETLNGGPTFCGPGRAID